MDVRTLSPARRRLHWAAFVGMLVVLPVLSLWLGLSLLDLGGRLAWPGAGFFLGLPWPRASTVAFYLAWVAFQAALYLVLPGRRALGVALDDGTRLAYPLNGLWAALLSVALAVGLVGAGVVPGGFLYDRFGELVVTANVVVFLLCFYVAWLGRRQATPEERERNALEAYFVGAARNPRNGVFDWKFFCESRPGMILWVLLNLSFAAAQHERHGALSNAMVLVVAFQLLYVFDYFVVEDAILTTWDIRHEPFGWMLCWGSLVWVPFTYALQGLWLVEHPIDLPLWGVAGLVALNLTGYAIFRGSNLQKHRFRSNPDVRIWGKPATYLDTARGTKLLTSGWWGLSRHANYLGDLLMALAWCLTTGFHTPITYFYFAFMLVLLVHRERRDHAHCARRYGADWDAYVRRVPWRILPGVY